MGCIRLVEWRNWGDEKMCVCVAVGGRGLGWETQGLRDALWVRIQNGVGVSDRDPLDPRVLNGREVLLGMKETLSLALRGKTWLSFPLFKFFFEKKEMWCDYSQNMSKHINTFLFCNSANIWTVLLCDDVNASWVVKISSALCHHYLKDMCQPHMVVA